VKTISAGFLAMLQNSEFLVEADLYTITLQNGTVMRYTSAQSAITYAGNTYAAAYLDSAPGFVRGSTTCKVGLESDDLEVDILFDTTTLLSGQNPAAFVLAGGLDNAVLQLDKALAPDWSNPVVNGIVNLFTGYIGEASVGQGKITLTVNSRVKILNTSFPRNYFLPQDNNALFSTASGLSKASYAVSGSVVAGSSRTAFTSNCTQADGWFALGAVTWLTGGNAGLTSFVKAYAHTSGAFTLVYPLAAQPAAGDTFTAYPGYDRTQATCQTKFNNLAHFRGFPYVPTPETLELGQAGSPPTSIGGGGGAGVGGVGRGPGGQAGRLAQR
jgi:uncharacterized phage protein (TIGR02218 family)